MRKSIGIAALLLVSTALLSWTVVGQNQKLAQTGMKFLSVGAGGQPTAMGEAVTAIEGSSLSMFYNPANMARLSSLYDISLGQTRWIADINHNFASVAISPSHGDYGVFGVTLQFVDYGDLQETIRSNNEKGYLDVGTFRPTATAFGLGYARALSDRFSVGGNAKFVTQNLGNAATTQDAYGNYDRAKSSKDVMVFDFGMLYRTGYKSLNFGVSIRNFSQEVKYEREGFQLPLLFKIGVSMNALDLTDLDNKVHSLVLAVDATHPRDYPEQVNLGAEYLFMQILAIRGGYMSNNDEYSWTAGMGLQKSFGDVRMGFDYSYMKFGVFNEVSRISFQLTMLH